MWTIDVDHTERIMYSLFMRFFLVPYSRHWLQ